MAYQVKMPRFGETMTEGKVTEWLKEEGEVVEKGEILFKVETDKSVLEVESEASGVLKKKLVDEYAEVEIGTVIAIIAEEDEEIGDLISEKEAARTSAESEEEIEEIKEEKAITPKTSKADADKITATPAARRVASENQVDLSKIEGSGPYSSVKKDDVINFINESRAAAPAREEKVLSGIRKLTASRMSKSAKEVPHVTLTTKINVSKIMDMYDDLKAACQKAYDQRLTFSDILIKAAAVTLKNHRNMNAHFSEGKVIYNDDINIGLAVDMEKGLVVPVVKNVSKKSLAEIAEEREKLVDKAQNNDLSPEDQSGASFTITNLGKSNIDHFNPIINIPEVAILGIGRIKKEAVVEEDEVKIAQMMGASLSFDHRANDGAPAARFLNDFKDTLENGLSLLV